MKFRTVSGSVYRVRHRNDGVLIWERLTTTPTSGAIRSEWGELVDVPEVVMGKPVTFEDTSVLTGFDKHFVVTSAVEEILAQ